MMCGVPQGLVLGPTLWNIGYNWVLRVTLQTGLRVVCYADNTLVLARGNDFVEAARLAEEGTAVVVGRIQRLGLRVALDKTEAMFFYGPRRKPPSGSFLLIDGVQVPPTLHMRYLGLTLDAKWKFDEHFSRLCPKVIATAGALSRLLPNLGGPSAACRRLYTGVVRSMALYGSPVWAETLTPPSRTLLRQTQRVMAVRVIRGYRTVSYEAACAIAGTPPWDLEAKALAKIFRCSAEVRREGARPSPEMILRWRERAQREMMSEWRLRLEAPLSGHLTISALQPCIMDWVSRKHGSLTFRLVQVLTGHGCFGRYLHRIGREPSPQCHECGADEETAQHVLEQCLAWSVQRQSLINILGVDLSLPAVVQATARSASSWEAVVSFCEHVMLQKEAAERRREDDPLAAPSRKRKPGRNKRLYGLMHPP
jgi:hypothetical protein